MKVLISWLGKTDIDNMQADKLASIATLATKHTVVFDQIIILANTWDEHWQRYEEWLNKRLAILGRPTTAEIFRQSLVSPTDYSAVAAIMQRNLSTLSQSQSQIYINLTSGTPTMAAVSVLLGKGIYQCQLLQTGPDNTIEEVQIPFDFDATYAKVARTNIKAKVVAGPSFSGAFKDLVANSAPMQQLIFKAQKLAATDLPALLLGETGTGKEVLANAIHAASARSEKPMKVVNCGAIPENLVDSILFGHVKGAFTGADREHVGFFEQADGGTLFLDEVGELPPSVQVKLLRALQQGEITRVGDSKTRTVDVRILAATHRPITQMVGQGAFREDLYFRLAVGVIELPALRERRADIPELLQQILAEINTTFTRQPGFVGKAISKDAIKFAESYDWPGNIRALWNTLNRAVLWAENQEITAEQLQQACLSVAFSTSPESKVPDLVAGFDVHQYIDDIKEKLIYAALEKANGNLSKASKMLGLANHQTLSNWMDKLNIKTDS
jgi:transcriptional regulator with PAS, ATPase and Fis domain